MCLLSPGLDGNNRKPIFRMWFNASQRYLGTTFDEQKNEQRNPIEEVEDIYRYTEELRQTAQRYD